MTKSRGILFGPEMVRAILDGRKTQTRRVVKLPPCTFPYRFYGWLGEAARFGEEDYPEDGTFSVKCPYGVPGSLLYVREMFYCDDYRYPDGPQEELLKEMYYRADGEAHVQFEDTEGFRWRPSIHMPKWASRLWLRIVSVRVERVADISEADATAEGIYSVYVDAPMPMRCMLRWVAPGVVMTDTYGEQDDHAPTHMSAKRAFECLWDSINAKRGYGWDANPWCWILTYERTEARDA